MAESRAGRRRVLLIAPDSFKGTYAAPEVAAAIARGVPGPVDVCPVADGGEGTMALVVAARGGSTSDAVVHDPLGRELLAPIGWIDDGATAIVETAHASGLGLVAEGERDAEAASSFGTGELIAAAAGAGARTVVVAVGGSATSDGGRGALEAIEAAGGLGGAELVVACDVTTAFEDAAVVFGPQKGADAAAVRRLTEQLDTQAATLPRDPRGVPRTGGAGGLSGALWAVHGARLVAGAAWVLEAVGFDTRLARATAVVTGEGRLDAQTFQGKLVGEIAARCRRADRPLHAVVGSCELDEAQARALGLASVHVAGDAAAMAHAGAAIAAVQAGRRLS